MRTRIACLAAALLVGVLAAAPAAGKDKDKERVQVTGAERQGDVDVLTCLPKGRALFHVPQGVEAGTKLGLLVTLHGHGSQADNMVLREFAARRRWAVLSVEGRGDVQTPQGPGHQWDATDAGYVAAVAKWCVASRNVDPAQIVAFGHSAGGTMALNAYAADPSVFAGLITCSAPMTPDKRHEDARVVVFLGTADPNYGNAKTVQNQLKKESGHLALAVMRGAEHNDIPTTAYLDLAVDWVLAKKSQGHEVSLPKTPPAEPAAGFRHVLYRYKGAADAPKDLKRSRDAARAAAEDLLKQVRAGKALLSHEAQAHSDDADSQPLGGAIAVERLAGFGGALAGIADAAPGADRWSGPFESPAGWHVVERAP